MNFISLELVTQKCRNFPQMKRFAVIMWGANSSMKPSLSCLQTEVILRFYGKMVPVVGIEFKRQYQVFGLVTALLSDVQFSLSVGRFHSEELTPAN
jgi:hypothetical protein